MLYTLKGWECRVSCCGAVYPFSLFLPVLCVCCQLLRVLSGCTHDSTGPLEPTSLSVCVWKCDLETEGNEKQCVTALAVQLAWTHGSWVVLTFAPVLPALILRLHLIEVPNQWSP